MFGVPEEMGVTRVVLRYQVVDQLQDMSTFKVKDVNHEADDVLSCRYGGVLNHSVVHPNYDLYVRRIIGTLLT